jgi:histidinol-phosphate aminotransferase
MNLLGLVRDDLRDFAGYSSARRTSNSGSIWLNANESPWRNAADANGEGVHRYPEPQPGALRAALAALYGVRPEQLLIGRGSDEAIDLLVRAFCRPGVDRVLIAPPVFGMYAVCARLQGAALVEVALRDRSDGLVCDLDAIAAAALEQAVKLVFLCSPANPTGAALPRARSWRWRDACRGAPCSWWTKPTSNTRTSSPWPATCPARPILRCCAPCRRRTRSLPRGSDA